MPEVKAFVIVQIAIHDWDGYRQYGLASHLEIFDKFSGTLVGADDDVEVVEGSWATPRLRDVEPGNRIRLPRMRGGERCSGTDVSRTANAPGPRRLRR
jgi:hypothetical protein